MSFWNKVHEVEPLFDLLDDGACDLPIMSMLLIYSHLTLSHRHTHPPYPSPLTLTLALCLSLSLSLSLFVSLFVSMPVCLSVCLSVSVASPDVVKPCLPYTSVGVETVSVIHARVPNVLINSQEPSAVKICHTHPHMRRKLSEPEDGQVTIKEFCQGIMRRSPGPFKRGSMLLRRDVELSRQA